MTNLIYPEWPAPANIQAFTTTKKILVAKEQLKPTLNLPAEPIWLKQTHGTIVIQAHPDNIFKEADASLTDQKKQICAVLTADCMPVLICNQRGTHVAAIHAGWRGLANGILESTITSLDLPADELLVWLGPAISIKHFEVGEEVRNQFIVFLPDSANTFIPSPNGRWMANLYELARQRLNKLGVTQIYGGNYCTFTDKELFYSYRRDGEKTGRMMSLIWLQ